jgi:hypothetical protein
VSQIQGVSVTPVRSHANALNRFIVVIFTGVGLGLGLAPLALFFDQWYLIPCLTVFGIVFPAFVFNPKNLSQRVLKGTDYFLEFLRSFFYPSLLGCLSLLCYEIFKLVFQLGHWVTAKHIFGSPDKWAYELTAVLSLAFLFAFLATDLKQRRGRFSLDASEYPSWSAVDKRTLIFGLILCALILILTGIFGSRHTFWGGAEAAMMWALVAFYDSKATQEQQSRDLKEPVLQMINQLLEAKGYEVDLHPRTFDPSVDALLGPLDLFASKPGHSLAVGVTTRVSANRDQWLMASSLRAAAVVFAGQVESPEPVLVLVGLTAQEDLKRFASIAGPQPVRVIEISEDEFQRAQSSGDPSEVAKFGEELLGSQSQKLGVSM